MRGLEPKGCTTVFKPLVQLFQILEDRHGLPQPVPGIANVLLDLTFLPARRWVAELRFKNIVTGHRLEPRVDVALFSTANPINSSLHVVIDATPRNAAKDAEGMPVRIEQHLMRLQRVGTNNEGAAMRELGMRNL